MCPDGSVYTLQEAYAPSSQTWLPGRVFAGELERFSARYFYASRALDDDELRRFATYHMGQNLDHLPPAARQFIELQNHTAGRFVGRAGMDAFQSAGRDAVLGMPTKEDEEAWNRRFSEAFRRFLEDIYQYAQLYKHVSRTIQNAQKAAKAGISDIDDHLADIETAQQNIDRALEKSGNPAALKARRKFLRDREKTLKRQKTQFEDYKNTVLDQAETELNDTPPPDTSRLYTILDGLYGKIPAGLKRRFSAFSNSLGNAFSRMCFGDTRFDDHFDDGFSDDFDSRPGRFYSYSGGADPPPPPPDPKTRNMNKGSPAPPEPP